MSDSLQPHGLYRACQAPVHEILQARILERVAMPSCRGSSQPRYLIHISYVFCIGRRVLYTSTTWQAPYKIQKHIKIFVKTIRIYSLYYIINDMKSTGKYKPIPVTKIQKYGDINK